MKLGIGSYSYGWAVGSSAATQMTAPDLVRRALELGVGTVQIADNLPLHRLRRRARAALRKQASDAGIQLEVGTRGISEGILRTYLSICAELDAPILRTVIDTLEHRPKAEEVAPLLRPLMPEFESAGVALAIENHDRFPARVLRQIIEDVGSSSLGVCLDTANSLGAGEGIREVAEVLAPHVLNVHLKDVAIRRVSNLMGFTVEGRPAGRGDLDIPRLLDFLAPFVPPDCSAIVELWPPVRENLEDMLSMEEQWVVESVAYLRRHIFA